ncbi:MAG: NADH:ubiquinone oxidoreductase subunit F (NADH-binding)/NADH:ubiquinone oxidoreductase subunit E [Parasphingorhabdus sp.]
MNANRDLPKEAASGKRRKARTTPKGRQVEPSALAEVQELLGTRSRQRDLLIEHLHLIQDQYGHLSAAHIAALANEMRIAQTEVYEVATFYAHFDVVKENQTPPPALTIRVCDSIACEMAGARDLIQQLAAQSGDGIRVLPAPCMGRCDTAPVAEVGHRHFDNTSVAELIEAAKAGKTHTVVPSYQDIDAYKAEGGYAQLSRCLSGEVEVESVIKSLEDSSLRGLGGAGFPAGRKWRIVGGFDGPRLMAVNCDEGEPGTFKDRYYLESEPHKFIEGMLIAAWAVGIEKSYVYVRDEYPAVSQILTTEIEKVQALGLADHVELEMRRGAGAYICGEESAMIESIEGKRGIPRNRPPYVAEVGLFGRPTLEHNVETLFWIPDILSKGSSWYADAGTNGRKGWRSYSVSGRVNEPGVKLAPAGVTIRDLINDYCGGMLDGHEFKGYLPGGASGGILPASMDNLPLDFGTLEEHGCFIGSAAVVIFSDHDHMKDVSSNLLRFFRDESCGQCTPCRVGTEKAVDLMNKQSWNQSLLTELCTTMTDASICGLGQAAGNPILTAMRYFPEDMQ